jgi:hypothetical protein
VHELVSPVAGSDWSYGAAILTFLFPMLLFIGVAAGLYVLYTKPHLVPGHYYEMRLRAASHTTEPAMPGTAGQSAPPTAVDTAGISGHAPQDSDNEVQR